MDKIRYICLIFAVLLAQLAKGATILVSNQQQLHEALAKAAPGDTILLDKGKWNNVALTIETNGTKEKPIVIAAATPGAVQFTGNSFIKFGSDYVVVSGIQFVDGFSEKGAVVEFRKSNDQLANYCRLTNCVFDGFNKPGRFDNENWIVLWGQHNRIDHCTIGGKLTGGTTIIVELNDERSQQNHHEIDSNYFNGRLPLGSNGGETIRVGVSRYALTSSRTNIHHNYFERCNGEVEIISIKSGDNQVNNNTFYECEGGLVLRHGERNTVTGNIFIGNNKPYTGGVRIINPGHTVSNNLFMSLAGERFHSGFSVLNGVPNSLPNRYVEVRDVRIHNNTFIDCKNIVFGAGKDPERTVSPQKVSVYLNLIITKTKKWYEDANNDGGIKFANNGLFTPASRSSMRSFNWNKGARTKFEYNGNNYELWRLPFIGAPTARLPWMSTKNTGATWFTPAKPKLTAPITYTVSAAQSRELPAIVAKANAGDIIQLTDTGLYQLNEPLVIRTLLTIKGKAGGTKAQLVNTGEKSLPAFIIIENGGSVTVEHIQFNSAYKSYGDVQTAISTTTKPMNSLCSSTSMKVISVVSAEPKVPMPIQLSLQTVCFIIIPVQVSIFPQRKMIKEYTM
jgi:poly(beta-D-mannuronate) lyase